MECCLDREGRETVMTYGDGIWLIGFVLLPNGETNHDGGEALNRRYGRGTDFEKSVDRQTRCYDARPVSRPWYEELWAITVTLQNIWHRCMRNCDPPKVKSVL